MRTQFFNEMVNDTGERVALLRKSSDTLFLEQVLGAEKAAETYNKFPDDQNPLKSPAAYRRMLREQHMVQARLKAGL